MKYSFIIILLLGGFIYSNLAPAKIIDRDKMVFKVARSVFTLNNLKQIHEDIHNLKCMYDESLLSIIFEKQFKSQNLKYLNYREVFSKEDKSIYKGLMDFSKLLVYSRSQNIVVNPNIVKYFYLMAQKNKCSLKVFDKDKMFMTRFKEIVELEVFVRSRFLPAEESAKTTKADINKAVLASKTLLKSISRQIDQEVYW
jgi:hypothetical protein